jgi:predicted N-formylglutamate amidohydrolase
VVGENEPYSGAEPNAYTIPVHGERNGLPHVQIEVRHDLVETSEGVAEWAAVIGAAIDEIIDDPALDRIEMPSD